MHPLDWSSFRGHTIKALEYAWDQLSSPRGLPLSLRLIAHTHKILLTGARGTHKGPGLFRTSQNWIGGTRPGTARFVPPPPLEMKGCLDALEKYLHTPSRLHPLINIALIHVQFETIHPFLDGNGRIGRLLIALLLKSYGLLDSPILYVSLFFKRHQQTYYELLNKVRTHGAWEEWISFFLEGVLFVANDVAEASVALQLLISKDREKLYHYPGVTVASLRLFEELPKKPILSMAQAVEKLGLTLPTVSKAIKILVESGVLIESTGRKKDRQFRYKEYLAILAKDTDLIIA